MKCDEYKPSCQRCLSYRLTCPGYPTGSPAGPWLGVTSSAVARPPCKIRSGLNNSRSLQTHLACTVFAHGPRRAKNELEFTFWSQTVPQLIDALPSVGAAAAAFGASYEVHVLRRNSPGAELGAMQKYFHALLIVQAEVSELPHGALASMVACLLMAFTEVLQQRTSQASLHFQGAAVLAAIPNPKNSQPLLDHEDLAGLFEKIELHSATYVESRAQNVPMPLQATASRPVPKAPDRSLYRVLRASYQFTSRSWRWKYVHPHAIPPDLYVEQGRHLGSLRKWLSSHPINPSDLITDWQRQQLLVLRAQCLAGLLRCANILSPYETSYDRYNLEFEEIITLAELVLDCQQEIARSAQTFSNLNMPTFTPEMGIIQPLFMTVLKCRHPVWRRKALNLLRKSGREGPWSGAIEGTVLKAVIEAEESTIDELPAISQGPEQSSMRQFTHIPEKHRVHLGWVVGFLDQRLNSIPIIEAARGDRLMFAQVQMFKCRDLDRMLAEQRTDPKSNFWEDEHYWDISIKMLKLPE